MKKEILTFAGAMLCCFLWGSAFPAIKIGYGLWNIDGSATFQIIRFAGIRFFLAGILVIIFGSLIKKRLLLPKKNEWPQILLLSVFQTIGQYLFFYVGLAHTTGVNSAVVDSLTSFFAILLAAWAFHFEKLDAKKIIGCILGMSGVVLINVTKDGFSFRPLGDGLVVLSALCYGISSNMIKKYSTGHDTVLYSGYQFAAGGLVMTVLSEAGILLSEGFSAAGLFSFRGDPDANGAMVATETAGAGTVGAAVGILFYLALVSSVAYTLWGILLRKNDVSKISIFGFMNPVIGVVLSAVLLKETGLLGIRYFLALFLVSAGIILVNVRRPEKGKNENSAAEGAKRTTAWKK